MSKAQQKVRCSVCNELLVVNEENSDNLIEHLNQNHAGVKVFRFIAEKIKPTAPKSRRENGTERKWNFPKKVECRHCAKIVPPVMKEMNKANTILLNTFWCWPACCWSDWFGKQTRIYFYCSECRKTVGYYDPTEGIVIQSERSKVNGAKKRQEN